MHLGSMLTWPARIDCEREHRPFGSTEAERRILRDYEHRQGQWDDVKAGHRQMIPADTVSIKQVDLLKRQVDGEALARALRRTLPS
jgi:hypothetical protein